METRFREKSTIRLRVSVESFLIYAPISILAVPSAVANQLTTRIFFLTIYIGISVTCVIGLFLFLVHYVRKLFFKNLSIRQEMTLNVITISSAGLIRGFLVFLSFDWVSLTQPSELPARLLSSTATTLFWLLLISILVEDSRSFKDQFNLMFSTSILKFSKDIENPSSNVLRNKDADEFK